MLLTASNLHLSYGSTVALRGVDLSLSGAEVIALTGPSGSGKTSLLYCLAGLVSPMAGSVLLGDRELIGLSEDDAAAVRRTSMGFVFQFAELVPELTIRENVELPLQLLGRERAIVRTRVADLLARLDIADVAGRRPDQVSGGQAQRAAVARAVVHRPAVVFADEPTGALDSGNGATVLTALVELAREYGSAIVLVTHDETVARIADRRVRLCDGAVAEVA